jgi:DNA-binding PadR family transcriptional regulator
MGQTKRGSPNRHPADVRPEFSLLGFLVGRSMHGYDLYRQFQQNLGQVWHLSQSQMYSTIKRLETQGLVTGLVEAGGPKPSRRCLSITDEGRLRFSSWLLEPSDCSSRIMRLEFISRLFFASSQNPTLVSSIVGTQLARIERQLKNHERLLADLGDEESFNRLSLELRIRQLGAQLAWIEGDVSRLIPGNDAGRAEAP